MPEATRPDQGQPFDVRIPLSEAAVDRWGAFGPTELDFLLHVLGGYPPRNRRERDVCTVLRCEILDQLEAR